MSHIRSAFAIIISAVLIFGCSSPKPTQDNSAVFTQAVETALASLATNTPEILSVGNIKTNSTDGMNMVYIPEGEFNMGQGGEAHKVYLNAYWFDKTEVTNKMYAMCVSAGKCAPPTSSSSETRQSYFGNPEFDNYPVIYVSWDMAKSYCEWRGDRLPTRAEWEKASTWNPDTQKHNKFPWGDTFQGNLLNYCDSNCPNDGADNSANDGYNDTAPVGSYPGGASPYGALDTLGNVWEWTADWKPETYDTSPATNPIGAEYGEFKITKGSSWKNGLSSTGATGSCLDNGCIGGYGSKPESSTSTLGFRCIQPIASQTASNPSSTEAPTSTPQPNPMAIFEWSIETGELYILGSASDGNLYGLTSRSNYVIMSPKGEIISQAPIQEIRCRQGENYQKYAMHYLVRPDGNILCVSGFANDLSELTLISPANPPTLNTQFSPTAWFYPYLRNDQLFPSLEPEKPSDFDEWMFGNSHLFLASGDERKIYLADRGIGFIGRNNEFKIIPYPADFDTTRLYSTDMSDILVDTSVLITPWDDLYISYPLFDAIGNQNGSKTLLIKENGENIAVQAIPDIPTSNYYFPEREELYYLKSERKNLQLYRLDKNLNIMAIYKVSSDIYSLSQYALDANDIFVGHDNALYYWLDNTLYKYKLVGDNIATNNSAPAAVPTTQSSTIVTPSPASSTTPIVCSNFTSQLQPNMEAKVITDAINMREKPGTNQTIVGIIYAGDKVQLSSEPPICGDGYLWWKVQGVKSGITGWVVEGIDGERWLSP